MLFHSQEFLLIFLPVVLAAYYLAAAHARLRMALLTAASLVFYAYWDLRLLPLLVGSVLVNWLFARGARRLRARSLVAAGVAVNLTVLGIFKYLDFFADTLAALTGTTHQPWSIVLPLGISFFTFQQITYLVDLGRGSAPLYRLDQYALYVTFFPQLIAGPIVRHNELIQQFAYPVLADGRYERLSRGLILLVIGLLKKVVLAETLAKIADPVFGRAAEGTVPGFLEAWTATVAFTFQIYLDFSAYSDMAIGLALMFGFVLPVNFNAPFKATSIRDLWRRWHMTLTRFLTDYVYLPLGGSRLLAGLGQNLREGIAVVITMLLCGLWHGAAWTFVLWGGVQGVAMVVNQSWRRARLPMPDGLGWLLTFGLFAVSLVLFRSADFASALRVYAAMVGVDGWSLALEGIRERYIPYIGVAAALALLGPTSQHFAFELARPRPLGAVGIAVALVVCVLQIRTVDVQEFIYFQF